MTGESTWKKLDTGDSVEANSGSVIWLPKGARVSLVDAKDLSAFYVEQSFREASPVPDDGV